jgi:hypothetical protein
MDNVTVKVKKCYPCVKAYVDACNEELSFPGYVITRKYSALNLNYFTIIFILYGIH